MQKKNIPSKHRPLPSTKIQSVHRNDKTQLLVHSFFLNAFQLHQAGKLEEALNGYLKILELVPTHFDALQLTGTLWAQRGESAKSLLFFDKALDVNPLSASVFNNKGLALYQLKQLQLSIQSYSKAIQLQSDYPEAHSNLGNALQTAQRPFEAIASYENSIALRPQFADTYNNLGVVFLSLDILNSALSNFRYAALLNPGFAPAYYNAARVYKQNGDLNNALAHYDQAIKLDAFYLDAYNNKGNLLLELKNHSSALECFDKGLSLNPNAPHLQNNKGNVFREMKRYEEALECYRAALLMHPSYADAHNNMGNVLQELKRCNEALVCYEEALTHNPRFVDAFNNKGVVLRELKQINLAIDCYTRSIELNPQFTQGTFNLANSLKEINQTEDSKKYYDRVLKLDPNYQAAKWAISLSNIPTFLKSVDHLEASRIELSKSLNLLSLQCNDPNFLKSYSCIGLHQPFYLAYQERNNRDLISQYAQICHKVMSYWSLSHGLRAPTGTKNGRIKVGIVSDQIRYHSVWNAITKGLTEQLDANKFEIHIFYLGTLVDSQTQFAQSLASSFTQNLVSLEDWASCILNEQIDALLFPEIGMHGLTTQIANLRLAPLQLVTWGHPETTGIPSIDYFISADLLEKPQSQLAYSEKLFTLPSLGCTYKKLSIVPTKIDLKTLGINPRVTSLLCPGNLFKYSPDFDWVYPQIASRLERCQFIFLFKDGAGFGVFKNRLRVVFANAGLDVDEFVVFVPWLNPQEFFGLMQEVDLFIDSLGFSGFNTAMQAIECALPIITKEGDFMRGRFASAILSKMGLQECITQTCEAYIDLIVKVAKDPQLRAHIRQKIINARGILFDDLSPIRAFEQFLITKCRPNSSV